MNLNVLFDVPNHVAEGLLNGTLERVGGVVRDPATKKVVMWLRDGAGGDPGGVLTQPPRPNLPFGDFAQLANPLIGTLNLGVSVAGFAVVITQLTQISDQIRKIEARVDGISVKLDDQALAKLKAGVIACIDSAELVDPALRHIRAGQALLALHEARQYFNQQVLRSAVEAEAASAEYVAMALMALMAEVQTYIQLDEAEMAARVLRHGLADLCPAMAQMLGKVLAYRAAYLRPEFQESIDLDFITWLHNGFYRIQASPGEPAKKVSASDVFNMVRSAWKSVLESGDKWHGSIPQVIVDTRTVDDFYVGPIKAGTDKGKRYEKVKAELPHGLAKIAALVEGHDRLLGQLLQLEELHALGIKPSEFRGLTSLPEGKASVVILDPRWAQEVRAA